LCGLIPWGWFQKSVSNASTSILNSKALLSQTKIPIILFPSEIVAQDLAKQTVAFSILFAFLLIYGTPISVTWIAIIPLILIQMIFILATVYLLSALVPILPDLKHLIPTGLLVIMFGSGIFYHYDTILPDHRDLFFLNPIAVLIRSYREALIYGTWPDWGALSIILVLSTISVIYFIRFFSRNFEYYAQIVSEQ
jgi:lipopolysaccharide transport system permease protein